MHTTTEKIWHEYHERLLAFINRRVPDEVAEDLLQNVFVKIHTRLDSLADETRLESWLYQIARNATIDHYRTRKPTEVLPEWMAQTEAETSTQQELAQCLNPMIQHLPDKYRQAIQLSEIEQRPQKEIAQIAQISLSGAKSRVQRGRTLLRTLLHDCCEFELNRHNQLVSYEKRTTTGCDFC